ncbi:MAG: sigma-54-dependent transcriptional regulator, partial [bacterium]
MSLDKILVVDDEQAILEFLSRSLGGEGYQVLVVDNGERALAKVREEKPEVVLLDIRMPGMDGIETLGRIREFDKESSIILLTAYGSMDTVVEAMKLGAYDYITKPFELEKLKSLIKGALEAKRLARKVALPKRLEERYKLENIVGKNPKMFEVYKRIGRVVDNKATVLILGETGTGKELVARAIHFKG